MTLFVAFEILGTIAFAVSGAVVAISKKMDIFGVAILGMTTAVGGGILRDLILGITPPAAFQSPGYALTSIAVSMLVFLPRYGSCCTGTRSFTTRRFCSLTPSVSAYSP